MPVDAELLKTIYRELERGVVRTVELNRTAVFPRIDGVDDAYVGLLPGDEFLKLVSTTDGELNRELFYDNVRDFQGNNPVNNEINHTLADEARRRNFPLLNNGVTIVARSITRRGDSFTISDFQIVNGCQTTHVLFQNKASMDADTFIPIKLVATNDSQVVAEVIKATNRQTAVHPEALESLSPFHKELEDFLHHTRAVQRILVTHLLRAAVKTVCNGRCQPSEYCHLDRADKVFHRNVLGRTPQLPPLLWRTTKVLHREDLREGPQARAILREWRRFSCPGEVAGFSPD